MKRGWGTRIAYPKDKQPVFVLPDGQRRAIASVLNVRAPIRFGDYVWDDAGIGQGATWVRIDLTRQLMSVFRAGHEVGSTVVLFGTDGKPTPTGIFPVLEKAEVHRSSTYDADMPFMLRLTPDGVAIHASNVREGSATHGCVGIPRPFARLLFGQMHVGDQVVIVAS